jgi:hypothetical protein
MLRANAGLEEMEGYGRNWQNQWSQVLGLTGEIKPGNRSTPWVAAQAGRLWPCLPGLGNDLAGLMAQLGLVWEPVSAEKQVLSGTK